MDEYKIFVSRSFDARDKELTDLVVDYCRAAGYVPMQTDRASGTIPRDKIREALIEARVFLGLLTLDPDRTGATREWLITEIGMAEFARLPILLFLEEGVTFSPGDHLTSYTCFRRDNPHALCQAVVQALVELREDSRVVWGNKVRSTDSPYRFVVDDVLMEVTPDGRLRQERHIEVQSLISELRAIHPISRIITSSSSLGYFDSAFEFHAGDQSSGAEFEIRRNDPTEVSYQVHFRAPLARDEQAAFTVVHESRGSLPLTQEMLRSIRKPGDPLTNHARQGHAVKVATDRLALALKFPDAYGIAQCSPKLVVTLRDRVGDSVVAQNELERVGHNFKIRHNRLELEVEHPKLDHAYYFTWRPPTHSSLPESLTEPPAGA